MLVIGHEHQVVGGPAQAGVIIGAVPPLGVALWIGGHRDPQDRPLRELLSQKLHKFRVGVSILVGHVFDVHIDPVQAVGLHRLGDLAGELFPVFQGPPAQLPVPVVAQKGHHPHAPAVHLLHKAPGVGAAGEVQRAAGVQIEVVGGDLIQTSPRIVHPLDVGGGASKIDVGHAEPSGLRPGRQEGEGQHKGAAERQKAFGSSHKAMYSLWDRWDACVKADREQYRASQRFRKAKIFPGTACQRSIQQKASTGP